MVIFRTRSARHPVNVCMYVCMYVWEEGPAAAVSCVSVWIRRRSKHTYIHTQLITYLLIYRVALGEFAILGCPGQGASRYERPHGTRLRGCQPLASASRRRTGSVLCVCVDLVSWHTPRPPTLAVPRKWYKHLPRISLRIQTQPTTGPSRSFLVFLPPVQWVY